MTDDRDYTSTILSTRDEILYMLKRHGKLTLDFADHPRARINTASLVDIETPAQLDLYYGGAGGEVKVVHPREWPCIMDGIRQRKARAACRDLDAYGASDTVGGHWVGQQMAAQAFDR